jgi:hypothetical protein
MTVTKSDYLKILSYYNVPYENLTNYEVKQKAEFILEHNLCVLVNGGKKKSISLCTTSRKKKSLNQRQ